MENTTHTIALVSFFVSLIAVAIIHPYLVRFAKAKNIVDNPNTRKLQLHPVPVLGGLAIAFGIAAGLLVDSLFCDISPLFTPILCMIIMTYIGVIDDVLDLSPIVRLFVQVGTVLIIIYAGNGLSLDNFHGLWGFTMLPEWVSTPLTIVAVVGIINALNLIDGVDGLFSAFCITKPLLRCLRPGRACITTAWPASCHAVSSRSCWGMTRLFFSGPAITLISASLRSAMVMNF